MFMIFLSLALSGHLLWKCSTGMCEVRVDKLVSGRNFSAEGFYFLLPVFSAFIEVMGFYRDVSQLGIFFITSSDDVCDVRLVVEMLFADCWGEEGR